MIITIVIHLFIYLWITYQLSFILCILLLTELNIFAILSVANNKINTYYR